MRIQELLEALKKTPSVRDQIISDVRKHGAGEYFVRFTDRDKLGYSASQWFGKTPDVGHPKFSLDYIGHNVGRRALWFYPLETYLDTSRHVYASEQPYVWLVKLKPNAWLQRVTSDADTLQEPPPGKERVGIIRMSRPPAAIFFTHGWDLIGRYYNYADMHRRHGEVKGAPPPSFFDKIRGYTE